MCIAVYLTVFKGIVNLKDEFMAMVVVLVDGLIWDFKVIRFEQLL